MVNSLMVKIVYYTPYLKNECPNCKKEVEALRLGCKRLQIRDTPWKNMLNILGCPDCKFVFFQEDESEVVRAVKYGIV